ncbi:4'-phosphopantetheinyl transferase family protein [Micromonospora sp. KLBMP9576]|uniref:4'-phosphopantetheinyl transferase family protein n=1 Tax=Micromonospora sp. KLBMP9576 TaxID=3424769 RepID=UPI003D94845D
MPGDTRGAGLPMITVPTGGGRPDVLVCVRRAEPPDAGVAAVLSAAERRRHRSMAPARAAEFARGRTLVRCLVGAALGLPPQRVPLRRRPGGALALAGTPGGVSLSHSRRHTAAAYWPAGRVGVDVEEPPRRLDPALVRRCCGERSALVERQPAPRRAALFARVWTVQEACVKATGVGLAGAPWRIPVDPAAASGRWEDLRWYALDNVTPVGLAVAVQAPAPSPEEGP